MNNTLCAAVALAIMSISGAADAQQRALAPPVSAGSPVPPAGWRRLMAAKVGGARAPLVWTRGPRWAVVSTARGTWDGWAACAKLGGEDHLFVLQQNGLVTELPSSHTDFNAAWRAECETLAIPDLLDTPTEAPTPADSPQAIVAATRVATVPPTDAQVVARVRQRLSRQLRDPYSAVIIITSRPMRTTYHRRCRRSLGSPAGRCVVA